MLLERASLQRLHAELEAELSSAAHAANEAVSESQAVTDAKPASDDVVFLRERLLELEDYQWRLEQDISALKHRLDAARMFLRRAGARDANFRMRARCPRC